MKRHRVKKWLKTIPGVIGAALLTATVGALVAYFAPKLLDSATGRNGIKISVETNPAEIDTFNDLSQSIVVPDGKAIRGSPGVGCGGFAEWGREIGAIRAGEPIFASSSKAWAIRS
ncbi:MAG TPA: hypothetical protein VKG03_04975 [Solirubrobacterales bacterium]|nr:hypothetical protein [Solirubrobacterales bacterium]